MTPNPAPDSVLTQLATPIATEVVIRLAVSTRSLKPESRPTVGSKYRDLNIDSTSRPDVELWGEYVCLDKFENGPEGYHYFYFGKAKTQEQIATPYQVEPGRSRHYEWPAVLKGVLFAEDYEFPVKTRVGVSLTVERPRLVARENKVERTYALCRTVLKKYLSPLPFDVPQRPQPAASEIEYVINGTPNRLTCLHPTLTLPAAGGTWSARFTAGKVTGLPAPTRTFPATPLTDWEPFVLSQDHRQLESGVYELTEEWLIPPDRAKQPTF